MNGKNDTKPEAAVDLKPEKAEVYSHSESANWRLMRAIDFLLDYIIEQESTNQVGIKEPEHRVEEPENKQERVETDELTV
jgi:hypothetical protein